MGGRRHECHIRRTLIKAKSKDISQVRRRQRPIRKVGRMAATQSESRSMINHKYRIRRSHHNPDASCIVQRALETPGMPVTMYPIGEEQHLTSPLTASDRYAPGFLIQAVCRELRPGALPMQSYWKERRALRPLRGSAEHSRRD